ncbi:hypothetical protein [Rhodohalobacter sp. 8-1]|uniref:hypothetical protein n=1 Tax=Rhodohalobacter sp. 8-1 TaxID=3131972 RepID=UPI0030ED608B
MSDTTIHSKDLSPLLTKLGNRGVKKAQDENHRLGIANVYFKNGKMYYQLPNGDITTRKPKNHPQL